MTRRALDALLLLDKPAGITSNAALQQAKRLFRAEKAGHAGTLDPLASGLLPVLFGEATKFSSLLLDSEKEYLAGVRLGVATRTGDAEGEVLERRCAEVDDARVEAALVRFRGAIDQVPPMYSALKHRGRPLYEIAREGAEVERAPRRVVVSVLERLARSGDLLSLRVRCSKGTYVRTLAVDLGEALGTGAHLASLRRTAAGRFTVADAVPLEALAALDEPGRDRWLRPMDALLEGLPRVALDGASAERFAHGQCVPDGSGAQGRCQVRDPFDRLLGLGEIGAGGELRPLRLLACAAALAQGGGKAEKTL